MATHPVVLAQRALASGSGATTERQDVGIGKASCLIKYSGLTMWGNEPIFVLVDDGIPQWVHSCHNELLQEAIRYLRLNANLAPDYHSPTDLGKQELLQLFAPQSVPHIEDLTSGKPGRKGAIITLTGPYARALEAANAPCSFVGMATNQQMRERTTNLCLALYVWQGLSTDASMMQRLAEDNVAKSWHEWFRFLDNNVQEAFLGGVDEPSVAPLKAICDGPPEPEPRAPQPAPEAPEHLSTASLRLSSGLRLRLSTSGSPPEHAPERPPARPDLRLLRPAQPRPAPERPLAPEVPPAPKRGPVVGFRPLAPKPKRGPRPPETPPPSKLLRKQEEELEDDDWHEDDLSTQSDGELRDDQKGKGQKGKGEGKGSSTSHVRRFYPRI